MTKYLLPLAASLGLAIGLALPPIVATATPAPVSAKPKVDYKAEYDKITQFADEHCVYHQKKIQGLTYRICRMEDLPMQVSLDGPEGDNGPTAYFYGGRLYSFRETGHGEAWVFKDGKLMAEVEVGVVAPEYNKITTKFTAKERKAITDRAISSTRSMLKVFGVELRL
jgi:hypothetical protein